MWMGLCGSHCLLIFVCLKLVRELHQWNEHLGVVLHPCVCVCLCMKEFEVEHQ